MNKKSVSLALFMILPIGIFLSGCKNKMSEDGNGQQVQQDESDKNRTSNNEQQEQSNKSAQSDAETIDYSKSYASVLDDYRNFVKDYNAQTMDSEKYMDEPWSGMRTVSIKSDRFGYNFRDLNGNGKDELLLLGKTDDNYCLVNAIYSLVDGKPRLLNSFWDRYSCYIGKDGFIYTSSGSAWNREYKKYTIGSDGSSMKVIDVIGYTYTFDEETGNLIKDDNGEVSAKYYHSQDDGKKVEISEQKFDELYSQIPFDNKQVGLDFVALN